MDSTGRTAILVLASLLALGGCSSTDETVEPTLPDRLQAALDETVAEMGAPGATLAVTLPEGGLWLGAAGYADLDAGRPMQPEERFRVGSITKTFTASVVLQLRDEQRLSLDDPLEQWVAGFPNGAAITLEQLLRHTTGIYDVAYHPSVAAEPARNWSPEELVALAAAEPAAFAPGQDWSYSNTNYILLGLVVESVTGQSWASQVRGRLLDPLELADTFVEGDEPVTGSMARGYVVDDDATNDFSPSTGWAAGALVSNGPDLVAWLAALLGGQVLAASSLEEMKTPTALPGARVVTYGLGLDIDDSAFGPRTRYGHLGDSIIYRAHAYQNEPADVTVVALVNGLPYSADEIAQVAWDLVLAGLAPAGDPPAR